MRGVLPLSLLLALAAACGGNDAPADASTENKASAEPEAPSVAADHDPDGFTGEADLLSDIGALLIDELWAQSSSEAEPLRTRAERILQAVGERANALQATTAGLRLFVDARTRAAVWLADPEVGLAERAHTLARETLALAQKVHAANPTDRRLTAVLGDAHVGVGRVAHAAGDSAGAVAAFEEGLELLRTADKGRGSGTGSSEFRGDGTGGGGGRGRGQGRNRAQSVALKRHTIHVLQELAEIHRASGDAQAEVKALGRARLAQGSLCQVQYGQPNNAYQKARLGMAELIDRIGDTTARASGYEMALNDEKLVVSILREIYVEVPDLVFFERVVPQAIEVASILVELGRLEELRELTTQSFEDLKVLANLDVPQPIRVALEAEVCLQMARGLLASGTPEHRAEAANWFGRVVELLDALRVDGELPDSLAAVEESALVGIATLQG